jgi:type IV secretion system protein VirB1
MLMTPLELQSLARACAPFVAPATLKAVASAESGLDPLAIGVNGPRPVQLRPRTPLAAIRLAEALSARGFNLDLGLAQINSVNLARLGLTVASSFDPCRNLAAAAVLIRSDYRRAAPQARGEQAALWTALSLYNSGDPQAGLASGYVARVLAAARRLNGAPAAAAARSTAATTTTAIASPQRCSSPSGSPPCGPAAFVIIPQAQGDQP